MALVGGWKLAEFYLARGSAAGGASRRTLIQFVLSIVKRMFRGARHQKEHCSVTRMSPWWEAADWVGFYVGRLGMGRGKQTL